MVALTFHGGGDPATATAILDICAQRGAHITVLAIGTWLQDNPSMAAAILGGGHDLGNHTWSHQVLSDLDQDAVREEITRCRDLLVQLTGSPGSFFRTSSGQHASPLILDEAGAAGYPVCLSYDVDPEDWTDPGAAAARERCRRSGGRVDRQPALRSSRARCRRCPAFSMICDAWIAGGHREHAARVLSVAPERCGRAVPQCDRTFTES